jgi:hypothetical protein
MPAAGTSAFGVAFGRSEVEAGAGVCRGECLACGEGH